MLRLLELKDSWHGKVARFTGLCTSRLALISVKRWKDEVNESEIEPATFLLVMQYLNQLCHRVPPSFTDPLIISGFTPGSHNRYAEYCLVLEEHNSSLKIPQRCICGEANILTDLL